MYHIIVNPASKSGKGNKIWDKVELALKNAKADYRVHFTKTEGDALLFAKELTTDIDDYVNLIVLGGDGTMNEIVNGIVDFDKTRVGYIPTGSSNDFARDVKLIKEPKTAIELILEGKHMKNMDIGQVTYEKVSPEATETVSKKFVVSSGIGFDAAVCEEVHHSKLKKVFNKIRLGKLVYVGVAVRNLLGGDTSPCKIYIDDKEPVILPKFLFIANMVHKYEGGGFKFCPDADYTDDALDVCAVGALTRRRCFRILPTAYSGKHVKFKGIDMYKAKKVRVETDTPLYLHTDGEVCGKTARVEFISLPSKLHLFCK